jgi:hypothetical protein
VLNSCLRRSNDCFSELKWDATLEVGSRRKISGLISFCYPADPLTETEFDKLFFSRQKVGLGIMVLVFRNPELLPALVYQQFEAVLLGLEIVHARASFQSNKWKAYIVKKR